MTPADSRTTHRITSQNDTFCQQPSRYTCTVWSVCSARSRSPRSTILWSFPGRVKVITVTILKTLECLLAVGGGPDWLVNKQDLQLALQAIMDGFRAADITTARVRSRGIEPDFELAGEDGAPAAPSDGGSESGGMSQVSRLLSRFFAWFTSPVYHPSAVLVVRANFLCSISSSINYAGKCSRSEWLAGHYLLGLALIAPLLLWRYPRPNSDCGYIRGRWTWQGWGLCTWSWTTCLMKTSLAMCLPLSK